MKIKINTQKLFILTIVLEIMIPACKFCILQSIPGLSGYNNGANMITSLVLFPLIAISLFYVARKSIFIYASFLCFVIPVICTYLFFSSNSENLTEVLLRLFTVSFPMLCVSYYIDDWEEFFIRLYRASRIIVICAVIMQINIFVFGNVGAYDNEYSISLGYYCIVPFGSILYNYYLSKKKTDIAFSIILFLVVFISGSRGPLVSMALLFVYLYFFETKITAKKILFFIFFIFFIFFVFLFQTEIINSLIDLLSKFGISSRTLNYMKNGMLSSTLSRDNLRSDILSNVSSIGIMGNGVLSQNRLHNIFLENVFSFGILSVPINIFIIYATIKSFFLKRYDRYHRYLIVIFLSYAIVDACLNLTVLGKDMFWIFLGLFLSIYRTGKLNEKNNIRY